MSTFNPIFYYNIITAASVNPYIANQIAYYPFDSNANDLINAQNGTSTNISYANLGKVGNSATFNGSSSLITVADTNNFSFDSGAFSINAWVYPVGNSGLLINKRSATFIEYQMSYNITLGTVTINLYSGGTTANMIGRAFNTALTTNTWQMLTFTFPGGTSNLNIKLYKDAVAQTASNLNSGVYVGMLNTTANVVLGRQGNVAAGFFNGRLDQTRFWKGRELTPVEVLDIYNTLY